MLFILLSCILNTGSGVILKFYTKTVKINLFTQLFMMLGTGIFSILSFSAIAGYNIVINNDTLFFGFLYACAVMFNSVVNLYICTRVNLIIFSLINSLSGLLVPSLFSILFFGEIVTWYLIVAGIITIASVILPLFHLKNENSTEQKNLSKKEKWIVSLFVFLSCTISGGTSIITKFVAISSVVHNYSYFFITNVFMTALLVLFCIPLFAFRKPQFINAVKTFPVKALLLIILGAITSNTAAIFSLEVLATLDLSYASFASRAICQVLMFLSSIILFKTKPDRFEIIASVLGLSATAILFIPTLV